LALTNQTRAVRGCRAFISSARLCFSLVFFLFQFLWFYFFSFFYLLLNLSIFLSCCIPSLLCPPCSFLPPPFPLLQLVIHSCVRNGCQENANLVLDLYSCADIMWTFQILKIIIFCYLSCLSVPEFRDIHCCESCYVLKVLSPNYPFVLNFLPMRTEAAPFKLLSDLNTHLRNSLAVFTNYMYCQCLERIVWNCVAGVTVSHYRSVYGSVGRFNRTDCFVRLQLCRDNIVIIAAKLQAG
jgi:hypothetical protein